MTAPEVIMHAKHILTNALADMDALLAMYNDKEVQTMDLLMTRKEAAYYLGRTVKSIDRLCREGKIVKTYLDGQPRIRKSELLRYRGIVFEDAQKQGSELDAILQRFRTIKRK